MLGMAAFVAAADFDHARPYCPFDAGSGRQLRELLKAVAVYASGGRKALEDLSSESGTAMRLLEQLC